MSTSLEHVDEPDDIGIHIGMGMVERVAHAGLSSEMDDTLKRVLGEQPRHGFAVGDIQLDERKAVTPAELGQSGPLQVRIVIGVEIIDADHFIAAVKQLPGDVIADETGSARDE